MLSLGYQLEKEIEINGETYQIDMAYDNIMRVLDLMKDEEIDFLIRIYESMNILLDRDLLKEKVADIEALVHIYINIQNTFIVDEDNVKPLVDLQGNPMPKAASEEVYSLKHDADYIYASFIQAYKIDLLDVQGELDWRKFNALLQGLPSNTKFKEVIEIRQRPYATGKGSQKQNKDLRELKNIYALPGHSVKEGE